MTEKPVKKVKVKMLDDTHTHAGVPCKKGDEVEVTEAQAVRLVDEKKKAVRV